jgi:hypothetical protein
MKSTIFFVIVLLSGCSTILGQLGFEETYAEKQAGYSYVPVEPSSVKINCTGSPPVITGNNCVFLMLFLITLLGLRQDKSRDLLVLEFQQLVARLV